LERGKWEGFFDEHAPRYMENAFTANTRAEIEFLLDLIQPMPGSRFLDIGCGTGRHAVALAKAGFHVTGVDISEGMLQQARIQANEQGVEVEWIKADATKWQPELLYDHVLCLCEGGLGLPQNLDPISHDLSILRLAYNALRPNGMFVSTQMNGYALIRQMTDELVQAGRFDPATMVANYEDEWDLPEGKRTMTILERQFIPPEMVAMLRHVGFEVRHVWGGTAGEWGRRPIKLDEVEAMYVCVKV
jgi:2-polyprenyl-3-methyl-5-hydroxy-6-metoxy-1,4-benzoquinol methylase